MFVSNSDNLGAVVDLSILFLVTDNYTFSWGLWIIFDTANRGKQLLIFKIKIEAADLGHLLFRIDYCLVYYYHMSKEVI